MRTCVPLTRRKPERLAAHIDAAVRTLRHIPAGSAHKTSASRRFYDPLLVRPDNNDIANSRLHHSGGADSPLAEACMTSRYSRLHGEARDPAIPMLVVCADGTVGYANPAAHRLLGYPQGMLPGYAMEQLAPDTERAALMLVRAAGENATNLRIRSRAMRADGRVLDVSMTIEPCLHDHEQAVDVFVSYKPLAPWEAQRFDEEEERDSVPPARLAG